MKVAYQKPLVMADVEMEDTLARSVTTNVKKQDLSPNPSTD